MKLIMENWKKFLQVQEFKLPPPPGVEEDFRTGNAVGYMGVKNALSYDWSKKNGQATLEFADGLGDVPGGTIEIINPAKGEVSTLYNMAMEIKTEPKLKASKVEISKSENPPKLVLREDNSKIDI
jgi:hypothetical protein